MKLQTRTILILVAIVITVVGLAVGLALWLPISHEADVDNDAVDARQDTANNNPYVLAVLTIAKNESMVIEEFLTHYHEQGVDHMFLIDNGSTDNMAALTQPWQDRGWLTYVYWPEPHHQVPYYNQLYRDIRHTYRWCAVVDVDEYLFGVQRPLKDFLLATGPHPDIYHIHWTMFGSHGHETQPTSIRQGFLSRSAENDQHVKALFQTQAVYGLNIHTHTSKSHARIEDVPVQDTRLRLHHYAIMSWEYFQAVKMTRGDADTRSSDHVRDRSYFERYNQGRNVIDRTLADLSYSAID